MGVRHQRVTQAILLGVKQHMVPLAKALFVDAHAGIGLHHRAAQKPIHIGRLDAAAQRAQRALALLLERIPHGDGIDMITHGCLCLLKAC